MLGTSYLHDDALGELLATASVARLTLDSLHSMPRCGERDRHLEAVAVVAADHHEELTLRALRAAASWPYGGQG